MSSLARVTALAALGALLPLTSELSADLGLDGLSAELEGVGEAEAAFIRRAFIKKKGASGNFRSTVIVGQGGEGDSVETVRVELTPEDGGPETDSESYAAPLDAENGKGTWHFTADDIGFESNSSGYIYTLTATLLDVDGAQVGEVYTDSLKVQPYEDPVADDPSSVSIVQIDDTNFRLEVVPGTAVEGDIEYIQVIATEWEITEPTPEELILTADDSGVYADETLTFGDPASAAGQTISLVVDFIDVDGSSLGAADFEIVVEGF